MLLQPTLEQIKIINPSKGNALVKAGPGCAKTTTLALRAKHMIKLGYEPNSMVLLTYGKALASDIQSTLFRLVGKAAADITVSTIHSFSYQLVTNHHKLLGFREPPDVGDEQLNQFIKSEAKRTGLKCPEIKKAFDCYDSNHPDKVVDALGKGKAKEVKRAYNEYSKQKKQSNTLNFDDMIRHSVELLEHHSNLVRLPYQHLMVDELQDINLDQKKLLILLAKSPAMQSTVMVGDPLQSIYGWRQASLRFWRDIENTLKPKLFTLTDSFRIPKQAMKLVNNLGARIDKDAPVLKSKVNGEAPVLVDLIGKDAHNWLAKEIKTLLANKVEIDQIAILGKTRKELSQAAIALRERQISITERYHPDDHNHHRTHLLALIQLTRLEQQRIARSSKKLNREERDQARNHMYSLWFPDSLIQLLQERIEAKPKAILSVTSKSEHYNRVNDLANAIRKAAGLTNVESAVQCLIDASKAIIKDRDEEQYPLLLRDLVDIKIKVRGCADLDDIEDNWFGVTTGNPKPRRTANDLP